MLTKTTTKTAFVSAGALALAMAAAPAMAQSFSPAPSSGTISGSNVTLQQSITLQCNVSANYSVNASGQASLSGESFSGGFFCGTAIQATQNWEVDVVPGSTSQVDITVGASTITGDVCSGTVRVPYDNATGRIELNNIVVPSTTGGADCRVDGDLFTSPRLEIVP